MILRPATLADSAFLFACKNELHAIEMSLTQKPVTQEEHDWWLPGVLGDPNRHLFIAENSRVAVGTGRIDVDNGGAIVSFMIVPQYRGEGFGTVLAQLLCDKAKALKCRRICAIVNGQNTSSLVVLMNAGFLIAQPKWLELTKELG